MTLDLVGTFPHELRITSVRAPLVRALCTCHRWGVDWTEQDLLARRARDELLVLQEVTREHAKHLWEVQRDAARARPEPDFY